MYESVDLQGAASIKAATSYTSNSLHDAVKLRLGQQGLATCRPQTIPQFFRESCHKYADLPALAYQSNILANRPSANANRPTSSPTSLKWVTLSYAEYAGRVEQAALILLHVGLQPHSSVGILAFNCPEWFYAELGALRAGGVVAGIYPSNSAEAVYHVLDTSEATVCVVDDAEQMAKVRAVKSRLPRLRAVVQLHAPYAEFVGVEEGYYRWADLAAMQFDSRLREELALRERDVGANECALLIFTSGTVGMPKAVMVSHDAVLYCSKAVTAAMAHLEWGREAIVTYLPLNHIAAQMFDIFLNIESGGCVYFADRSALKGTLDRSLAEVRPTVMFGVPRIYEKIREKLGQVDARATSFSRRILDRARQVVQQHHTNIMQRKPTSPLKYWFASKVTQQVKVALGLERCKCFLVGGAPVPQELKQFFMGLDMPLLEVYGMSETSGVAALNLEPANLETVGKAIEGVEFKIYNPDGRGEGEICIRGRSNFMGYLKDPSNTKESLKEDGWLHSGDVGYLDTEGNLIVNGRIKELIITAGGENIAPVLIENAIKRELNCISNAMVVGERKKYLTVLLTFKTDIDPETGLPLDSLRPETREWLQSLGLGCTLLSEVLNIPVNLKDFDASNVAVSPHPKVSEALGEVIQRANLSAISNAHRVQYFSILPHDFSIPTGELGPTLKMRRNIVLQKYANVIEKMYKK